MLPSRRSVSFLSVLIVLLSVAPTRADDKKDAKVKEVVSQFLKGIKDNDVDQLMKVSDVPWLGAEENVVKDRKELRNILQQKLDRKDRSDLEFEYRQALTYSEYKGAITEKSSRQLFRQVIGENDYFAYLEHKDIKSRYFLVRITDDGAKIVGGPYRGIYLIVPNKIPDVARELLDKADEFTLYSLDPVFSKEKPKDDFHSWKVIGQMAIKDVETRKKVVASFDAAAAEYEGGALKCFNPRHGIRVKRDGKVVDIVICFECKQFQMHVGDAKDEDAKGFLITSTPEPFFSKLLRDAGIRIAEPGM